MDTRRDKDQETRRNLSQWVSDRAVDEGQGDSQPDQVAHHIKIQGLQHFLSREKSHCEAAGVHWAK